MNILGYFNFRNLKNSKNVNPYVALDIVPSEKNTKKKTKTAKDNPNPEFNERFFSD